MYDMNSVKLLCFELNHFSTIYQQVHLQPWEHVAVEYGTPTPFILLICFEKLPMYVHSIHQGRTQQALYSYMNLAVLIQA